MSSFTADQPESPLAELSEAQARRVRVTCEFIDRMLVDVERVLALPGPPTLFPRYTPDIEPETHARITNSIVAIRAAMKRALVGVQAPDEDLIPASRAAHVALGTAGIAAEELKPRYMRGYGELSDSLANALETISVELCKLLADADKDFALLNVPPSAGRPQAEHA